MIGAVLFKSLGVDCSIIDMDLPLPLGIALAPVTHLEVEGCEAKNVPQSKSASSVTIRGLAYFGRRISSGHILALCPNLSH